MYRVRMSPLSDSQEQTVARRPRHDVGQGRVSPLLQQVPVYVILSDDMGQRGAHLRAVQARRRGFARCFSHACLPWG